MTIYKIVDPDEWAEAAALGRYAGSAKDREDGYLHFSTAAQLCGTLAKYYANATMLMLVSIDETRLTTNLRYEPARDGDLFPHLYEPLPLSAVIWAEPITRGDNGAFVLPGLGA